MKFLTNASAAALALVAYVAVTPSMGTAQDVRSESASVGGALDEPVGRMIEFSVGVSGTGIARLNLQRENFSYTRSGNDDPVVTGGGLIARGAAIAAPGSSAFVSVNRQISPARSPDITINQGNNFATPKTFGNVDINIGNRFDSGNFASAPSFSRESFFSSRSGGFFSN